MKEKQEWDSLIEAAMSVLNPREISPFIEAGGVSAAILTEDGNIYTGVCIDMACSLGMCAERNAISTMITNGESKIKKLVCFMRDCSCGSPCGACREYLMQLDKNSKDIQILTNKETYEYVRLEELVPDWWGYDRYED